ncbi:immunity 70 family protein [Agathobaculum sp.]|uniref:immunity 70 family protein n=1 Tax=Agathobaculum sp. TaxID=2048138 RepID=UPI003AB6A0CD
MTAFTVKYYMYTIGTADFLHSFFSTVCGRLENGKWGSRYPYLMNELYQGMLSAEHLAAGAEELVQIKKNLARFAPNQVIWDIDDRSLTPPWGDNISDDITDLSNYFVTSDGNDFLTVFSAALDKARELNVPLTIRTL